MLRLVAHAKRTPGRSSERPEDGEAHLASLERERRRGEMARIFMSDHVDIPLSLGAGKTLVTHLTSRLNQTNNKIVPVFQSGL